MSVFSGAAITVQISRIQHGSGLSAGGRLCYDPVMSAKPPKKSHLIGASDVLHGSFCKIASRHWEMGFCVGAWSRNGRRWSVKPSPCRLSLAPTNAVPCIFGFRHPAWMQQLWFFSAAYFRQGQRTRSAYLGRPHPLYVESESWLTEPNLSSGRVENHSRMISQVLRSLLRRSYLPVSLC